MGTILRPVGLQSYLCNFVQSHVIGEDLAVLSHEAKLLIICLQEWHLIQRWKTEAVSHLAILPAFSHVFKVKAIQRISEVLAALLLAPEDEYKPPIKRAARVVESTLVHVRQVNFSPVLDAVTFTLFG